MLRRPALLLLALCFALVDDASGAASRRAPQHPGARAAMDVAQSAGNGWLSADFTEPSRASLGSPEDGRTAGDLANLRQLKRFGLARTAVALGGFALYGLGLWLRRRRRDVAGRWHSLRLVLLCALAAASVAGYYNFFRGHHPAGFKGADVFHYYVGSKYFAELGYFELYHCTLAALIEQGRQDPDDLPPVRSQRTLRLQRPETTRMGVKHCPGNFERARWQAFERDIGFFAPRVLGQGWAQALVDHGYNPTPVWTAVGALFSERVPADSEAFPLLIAMDRILIVLAAGLILWAFGLEVACLAFITWGTGPLWGYIWIGDAFLRNLWLVAALAGLCLLKREKSFSAGVLLALSSLVRIFPAIFIAGYLAHALLPLRLDLRWRAIAPAPRRFAAGVALSSLVLITAGAIGSGRGLDAYLDFGKKMNVLVAQPGNNKIGLSALAADLVYRATTTSVTSPQGQQVRVRRPAPVVVGVVRSAQLLAIVLGLFAFWRALPRLLGWESAALGFALVPLLTSPANYYYGFVLAAALLAARRPWQGVALAVASMAWIAAWWALFPDPTRYLVYDGIAVLFVLSLLIGTAVATKASPAAEIAVTASTTV